MRQKHALIAGVIAGIAAPGSIASSAPYRQPEGTDLQRMRGDVARLGRDFSTVIRREHGKQAAAAKSKA